MFKFDGQQDYFNSKVSLILPLEVMYVTKYRNLFCFMGKRTRSNSFCVDFCQTIARKKGHGTFTSKDSSIVIIVG